MKLSEIFQSIQGEGVNAGKKSVFIRTSLCNLTCSWCDTKYTWDWENYDYNTEVKDISIDSIKKELKKFSAKNIIITGGEPLLQQQDLYSLLSSLNRTYFVEIETNGTIYPLKKLIPLIDQWNVSPKTSNSNNILKKCEINNCYRFFQKQSNAYFKFVVENSKDISEIQKIVDRYQLEKSKIILMPQASTKEELIEMKPSIQSYAKNNGFQFTSRLHVMKWGNMRGR